MIRVLNPNNEDRSRVGELWTPYEEELLVSLINLGHSITHICHELKRNEGGILARARKMHEEGEISQARLDHFEHKALTLMERQERAAKIEKKKSSIYKDFNLDDMIEDTEKMFQHGKTWTMVSLLQENIKTVAVQFDGSNKLYTYKTRIEDLEVEDYVVVRPRGEFQVAQIVEVHEEPQIEIDSGIKYDWIVQKVDASGYETLIEGDEKAYELLVNAEKHVERKKLVEAYTESLGLEDRNELTKLLSGS